ncbi:MAG: DUF2252 family protein [Blastocatellia bacterium]
MRKNHVVARIQQFNEGRNPRLLQLKYRAMQTDAFVFLRGACHLFYEDWPQAAPLNDAPLVWSCGDLHLENFGSYQGENRLVYFDINDFDEAVLAPCTWDLARFLTSVCQPAALQTEQVSIDLSGVVYLDEASATLLRWLRQQPKFSLTGCSLFTRLLLEEAETVTSLVS